MKAWINRRNVREIWAPGGKRGKLFTPRPVNACTDFAKIHHLSLSKVYLTDAGFDL